MPHERFETIEEVFSYADDVLKTFKNSNTWQKVPNEALVAVFSMNHAFCELSRICTMHLRRAKFYIDAKHE